MKITTGENIHVALTAVWVHRFRSLLTILGIVIGISTVVTVASLLTGLRKGIVVFFEELGPDNLFVYKTSGDPNTLRIPPKEQRRKPIRPEYADIVRRWCLSVEDAGAQLFIPMVVSGHGLTAKAPGIETDNFSLVGASANLSSISPRDLLDGRSFTSEEDKRAARVAVIGFDIAGVLFPDGRVVGRPVQVDGAEYIVIGVYTKAKGGFFGENGLDRQISIPLSTARVRYPQVDRFMLVIRARPGMRAQAVEEVAATLRKVRRTPAAAENDFSLSTPDEIIRQFDEITSIVVMVSIAIAALGLLVGGIGVMNIMLVSVTERTREIGVRKALGARRSDLIVQFLMEATALTGAGGVLGILFAMLISLLLNALLPSLPSEIPLWAVAAGFSVSVSVGLFFGVWPAVKASRLDPVEALRYE